MGDGCNIDISAAVKIAVVTAESEPEISPQVADWFLQPLRLGSGDKSPHRFLVGNDAVDRVFLAPILGGIMFFNISELGAINSASHRWPPENRNLHLVGLLLDVDIELIGENTHNPVCERVKSHGPEKEDNTGFKEQVSDVSPDNDPIKAGVIAFDIASELLYE